MKKNTIVRAVALVGLVALILGMMLPALANISF